MNNIKKNKDGERRFRGGGRDARRGSIKGEQSWIIHMYPLKTIVNRIYCKYILIEKNLIIYQIDNKSKRKQKPNNLGMYTVYLKIKRPVNESRTFPWRLFIGCGAVE